MKSLVKIVAVVAIVAVIAGCFVGCGGKKGGDKLKGTWSDEGVVETVYTFDGNGKGTLTVAGVETPITYSVDGSSVTINSIKYDFKVEGKTLTLTLMGADLVYKKK